ncbi:MAG: hypothetical protein IJO93_02870 [Clostridia bacterium]|nr:hypothetical protein [Clostridia bacterium]
MNKLTGSQITARLLRAGISPKYRAFAYLVYLILEFEPMEVIEMTNKELVDKVTARFNVSNKSANSNFRSLMDACAYNNGKKSEIFMLMAGLERGELPTVKEFLTAVECIIFEAV